MLIEQIHIPKASTIFDSRNVVLCNCSTNEVVAFLELITIPAFKDILISKYEDSLELLITVKKISCVDKRMKKIERVYTILKSIKAVHHEYISNSLRKFDTYDYLTIRCTLNAINQ